MRCCVIVVTFQQTYAYTKMTKLRTRGNMDIGLC